MAPFLAALALAAAPIHVERDLHYGASDRQTLDAYVAPGAHRAVVLIHGGGWHSGSKESLDPTALRFARNGWMDPGPFAPRNAVIRRYAGCSCPSRLRTLSPASFVGPGDAPLLLASSTREIVPLGQATEMTRRLRRAGIPHRLIVYPGSRHAVEYERQAWRPTLRFLAHWTQPAALP